MAAELIHGCCLTEMAAMIAAGRTFDSIVTDPPYGLNFMNRHWDAPDSIAFRAETWRLAYDLLEPGAMLAAFGGARTQHRIACAIEDAGFSIFDCALWLYGSGFPKGKTQLKPAYEPIILARKPTKGPLRPLAIDACRGATDEALRPSTVRDDIRGGNYASGHKPNPGDIADYAQNPAGRWPPNILHDGSPEVLAAFARFGVSKSAKGGSFQREMTSRGYEGGGLGQRRAVDHAAVGIEKPGYGDEGSAARFYPALGYDADELRFCYAAKASRAERMGTTHPCTKPLSLMRWLTKLITPPGGTVLDMFAGSGTTGLACLREGFNAVLIEREAEYVAMCAKRLGLDFNLEAAD